MVSLFGRALGAAILLCSTAYLSAEDTLSLTVSGGGIIYQSGASALAIDRGAVVADSANPANLDAHVLQVAILDSVDPSDPGQHYPPDTDDLLTVAVGTVRIGSVYVRIDVDGNVVGVTPVDSNGVATGARVLVAGLAGGVTGQPLVATLTREATIPYTNALLQSVSFANFRQDSPTVSNRLIGISLTRPDGLTSVSGQDVVRVVATNRPPTAGGGQATTAEDHSMAFTLTGADPDSTSLVYVVTGTTHGVVTGLDPSSGQGTFTPELNYFGAATITYTVTDERTTSAPATLTVTVTPVNDPPVFTKGGNVTILEDAASQSFASWASGINAGASNEVQTVTFAVVAATPALFVSQPAIATDGTLSFRAAPNANGTTLVTVVAQDDGGTASDGVDRSSTQTFSITITPVDDPPVVASVPWITTPLGTSWQGSLAATDDSLGATLLYELASVSRLGTLTVSASGALNFEPASVGDETVAIAISDGVNEGTTIIRITVSDPTVAIGRPLISSLVNPETIARGALWHYDLTVDPTTLSAGADLSAWVVGNAEVAVTRTGTNTFRLALQSGARTPVNLQFEVVVRDSVTGATDSQTVVLALTKSNGSNG